MSVTTVIQKTTVDSISSVVVTDITQDPISLQYIREIRVFDTTTPTPVLQYTLRMSAATQTALELTAPAQQF